MSSIFNWAVESYAEFTIKPSPDLEQPLYYSMLRYYGSAGYVREISSKETERSSMTAIQQILLGSYTIQQILKSYIPNLIAKLLGKDVICSVDVYSDNLYGTVIRVTTDLSARNALELWLKLLDYLPYKEYGVTLTLRWLGENNVSRDELIDYMVKIMIKSRTGPKALPGFDSVLIARKERE